MLELAQAYGQMYSPPTEPPRAKETREHMESQERRGDPLGKMLGLGDGEGQISQSQEFCNLILFIAFGIFSLFVMDSLVKLAARKFKV
jgi:hypothetical protein